MTNQLTLMQKMAKIDRDTIARLSALVDNAQADNNALRADLAALAQRLAVVEAKCAIMAAMLAGQDEAIRRLGMTWVGVAEVGE
jgi:uncharacterized protein YlxW (UPF0749 family)